MIDEIDAALKALLKDEALGGSEVDVVFDAPTKDWAARRNAPTVNAYLYDIREDVRKRTRGMVNEYDDSGAVVGRRLPPRFFNLSYLVTAWTQRPEDEHRLLAQMLFCFSNYEAMPPERLNGHIGSLQLPVEMRISLPPPEDRSFADVWTALGGELKPSLDVVLSVPLSPARVFTAGPPVTTPPVITLLGATAPPPERTRPNADMLAHQAPGSQDEAARAQRWAGASPDHAGGRATGAGSAVPRAGAATTGTPGGTARSAAGSAGSAGRPGAAGTGADPGRPKASTPSASWAWLALAGQAGPASASKGDTSKGSASEGSASEGSAGGGPASAVAAGAGSPAGPDGGGEGAGTPPTRGRRRRIRIDRTDTPATREAAGPAPEATTPEPGAPRASDQTGGPA